MFPVLTWSNRQRTVRLNLPKIRRVVEVALPLCVGKPVRNGVLPPEVEITLSVN
jgi:hypothetical protein